MRSALPPRRTNHDGSLERASLVRRSPVSRNDMVPPSGSRTPKIGSVRCSDAEDGANIPWEQVKADLGWRERLSHRSPPAAMRALRNLDPISAPHTGSDRAPSTRPRPPSARALRGRPAFERGGRLPHHLHHRDAASWWSWLRSVTAGGLRTVRELSRACDSFLDSS